MSLTMSIKEIFKFKNKKILAINPPVEDFAFFDLWSKPVGLLYLLERVRRNDNEVHFIDCIHEGAIGKKTYGREKIKSIEIEKPTVYRDIKRNYHRYGITEEELVENLKQYSNVDYIFVTSVMTYWYGGLKWLLYILKRELPHVPVLLGGIYARLCPSHALSLGYDYVVTDNWEPDVQYPAMDLYDKLPYGIIITSFGCPFSCEYCASNLLWHRYRRRDLKEIEREMDYQWDLGARDFAFYDDALLLDKENYFYPMCDRISKRYARSISLHTPNGLHVRQIDKECASVLMETGFKTIRLSLESIDRKMLETSSEKLKREDYTTAVRNLREVGYSRKDCETYILLGLPNQSIDSVKDTIAFVHENGGTPKLAEFSPIPGTKSFKESLKQVPQIEEEPLLQNNSVYASWISGNIAPELLQDLKNFARSIKE
ncbi:MAG: B12-binding domain-containing radical SAM protein [Synergistaceae bacterium]